MLNRIHYFFQKRPVAFTGLLIFLSCIFIYLINDRTISSNDNIPSSILGFNWFIRQDLDLEAFRNSYLFGPNQQCVTCANGIPYFFTEAPNGKLTSTYPIGTAIVAFPLYILFSIYLKFASLFHLITSSASANPLDITIEDFEGYRKSFEKLAGTTLTALSVVIFYLAARLKFKPSVALFSTFTFAFATPVWSLLAQGLRQHTASNLVVLAALLCLLKANRASGNSLKFLLLAAGFLCGLMPGVRITSVLFAIAAVVYAVFTFRKTSLFLFLGLPSFLINAFWNFHFFGFSLQNFIVGGYTQQFDSGASSYQITWDYFKEAFWGLLISPSDGFFTFSPILILSFVGFFLAFQQWRNKDEQLVLCLAIAAILIFCQYTIYVPWTGGAGSFGSRFMTDILPIVGFLVCYAIAWVEQWWHIHRKAFWAGTVAIGVLVAFSTGVQVLGAFGESNWGTIPLPLGMQKDRVWQLEDTQISRHANSLHYEIFDPIQDQEAYLQSVDGAIEQVQDQDQNPVSQLTGRVRQRLILQGTFRNTGSVPWYGYQTGMERGETQLKGQFFDDQGKKVNTGSPNAIFISGRPEPGREATGVGWIRLPPRPGRYRLEFALQVRGIGDFPNTPGTTYTIDVEVTQGNAGQPNNTNLDEL